MNGASHLFDINVNSGNLVHRRWCGVMVARNVVVSFRTTNPFRSRFDSGHRQIGVHAGSIPVSRVFFFRDFWLSFFYYYIQ